MTDILALCVLDSEGARIIANYYGNYSAEKSLKNHEYRLAFERELADRFHELEPSSETKFFKVKNYIVLAKIVSDVIFALVPTPQANEATCLDAFENLLTALQTICTKGFNSASIARDFVSILLTFDEAVYDGNIIETNSQKLIARVTKYKDE